MSTTIVDRAQLKEVVKEVLKEDKTFLREVLQEILHELPKEKESTDPLFLQTLEDVFVKYDSTLKRLA